MAHSPSSLVGLHGFTQSADSWGPFGLLLAESYPWIALDLPGHAAHAGAACSIPESARAIHEQLLGARSLLGYSLGARSALQLAIDFPLALDHLILFSGTPGIEDDVDRDLRCAQDMALADHIEAEDDLEAFLNRWLAQEIFSGIASLPYARDGRHDHKIHELAQSLRLAGTGSMEPLWSKLPGINPSVLLVSGSRDEKFTEIAARMVTRIPDARHIVIEGAGHAPHLQEPEACVEAVLAFLSPSDQ
ncbi:MAG: alpha/beta fold hydrolase [Actinomycetes bacterium]